MLTIAQQQKRRVGASVDGGEDEAILHMGDTISLLYSETPAEGDMYSEGSGYLYSEGFIDTGCKLMLLGRRHRIPASFPNCIFRILPRYKYDAHNTLNEMLERLSRQRSSIGLGVGNEEEEQGLKELQDSERAEQQENVSEYLRMAGKPVAYGQVIQLAQVTSNKVCALHSLLKYLTFALVSYNHSQRSC